MVHLLIALSLGTLYVAWRPGPEGVARAAVGTVAFLIQPLAGLMLSGLLEAGARLHRMLLTLNERRVLQDALPDLALSLSLAASDGQGVSLSLERLPQEALPVPLRQRLESLREDLRMSWDTEAALRRFGSSLGLPEGSRLVDALLRERALGVSLKDTLVRQADTLRFERLQRGKKRMQYLPYFFTVLAGLLFINLALLFGYPQMLSLVHQLGATGAVLGRR